MLYRIIWPSKNVQFKIDHFLEDDEKQASLHNRTGSQKGGSAGGQFRKELSCNWTYRAVTLTVVTIAPARQECDGSVLFAVTIVHRLRRESANGTVEGM